MEFIFEILFELIFEGSLEVSKNRKISKFIRYPLIALIIIFFLLVIGLIIFTGVLTLKSSLIGGLLFIAIGILMFIMSIIKFRYTYINKKSEINN